MKNYQTLGAKNPQKIVVFFHGFGASGHDLVDIGEAWNLDKTQCVFPHAPQKNTTGYQWFPLTVLSAEEIQQGLRDVRPTIQQFLGDLLKIYHLERKDLFLVGFSQGGMVALDTFYHFPGVGGVVSYGSAFFPQPQETLKGAAPTCMIHGAQDDVIFLSQMEKSAATLSELIKKIPEYKKIKTYVCKNIGHSISLEGIKLGKEFILNET